MMRFKSRYIIAIATFLVVIWGGSIAQVPFHIIPQPVKISAQKGSYLLTSNSVIGTDIQSRAVGLYLQDYLAQNYNLHLELQVFKKIPATLCIKLISNHTTNTDTYALNINSAGISINGQGESVFYGVQSLIQMLPAAAPLRLTAVTITDAPRFKWRGLSLDVSRHFFTVNEVKKYIDIMAHYKLNTLHWHLTDDEGWRIQINQYPRLTEVGARISYYEKQGKFRKLDNLIDGGRDGFYTKDDIRQVLKYATERFVTVIPEIEMPGHSEAAIFAYPELGCQDSTGAKHRVRMLDPSEHTFKFLQDVLTEVIELFPNQYIHIGGDEAEMADWLKSPVALALMKKEHLKDEREVQSYFIKRIEKFLISKNKKMIGWDEILQGGLAPSATVMSWRGEAGGIEAAQMRHQVIMTPLPYMYFDAPQANEELEPIGWNPPVPWQMVYNYEPLSTQLNTEEAAYILGAQGNIWTEKIPNLPHLEYMLYPRSLAVAELTWSAKADKDIDRFKNKLNQQYPLFKLWNLNARLMDIDNVTNIVTNNNRYINTLSYPLNGAKIRYSLNGRMPDSSSKAVNFPVKINMPLKDTLMLSTYTTWTLNNQHIRQQVKISHGNFKPVKTGDSKLLRGLSYESYSTKKEYQKLGNDRPTSTGVMAFPQAFTPSSDEANNWIKVNGYINISTEGDYEITSDFLISPQLYLDNVPVISPDKNRYAEPQKAMLHLNKGYYTLSGYYKANDVNSREKLIQLKTASGIVLNHEHYLFHQ